MPPTDFAYCRRSLVASCLRWRRLLAGIDGDPFVLTQLRACQTALVALRAARRLIGEHG